VRYGPIEATLDREQGANVWLTVGIREGKNREVRKVLERLGLKVNRLIRVAFGPFDLGDLDDGAVKEVETTELRAKLGEQIVAEANADFDAPLADHELKTPFRHAGARPLGREPGIPKQTRKSRPDSGSPRRGSRNDKKKFAGYRKDKNAFQKRRDRSGGPRPSRPK